MMFCRFCGTTESQFRISGKFGCEHCVSQFSFPKKKKTTSIPKSLLEEIEGILTKSEPYTRILSFRTRLTRNLKQNLFPFYDPKVDGVKRLLAENGFLDLLVENENSFLMGDDALFRLYLGGEDHLRFEVLRSGRRQEGIERETDLSQENAKRKKFRSLLRFLYQKQFWAFAKGMGYIASCPTNLGMGRRDSLLLGIEAGVDPRFFSLFEKLSEFGIEIAPSTDHRRESLGKFRGLVVKISWKNAYAVQKRQFYKILGLRGSL
ncbi:ATP--guanido phosphotransferase [Leptospira jelokensis]|uniref:ATP--guanido phosphotransferase n=1 Tax=Leptospira jelokensis TaxID=2484931 RepID=A0A4Z1A725_9LEPT|nr:ATP--guanido phosphotransferase [Leptospira jelokensis]TGL67472.1 ATP--guanido phosphotransferase [Leptospira jelokensis]